MHPFDGSRTPPGAPLRTNRRRHIIRDDDYGTLVKNLIHDFDSVKEEKAVELTTNGKGGGDVMKGMGISKVEAETVRGR